MIYWIGEYYLGTEKVALMVDTEMYGGEFSTYTARKLHKKYTGHSFITIGFGNSNTWRKMVEILLHEAIEFSLMRMNLRFKSDDDSDTESTGYTFMFQHRDYSQVIQRASWFVSYAWPDLKKVWTKKRKKR